ncbi:MAG: hypothetical protein ACPGSO_08940, partial [Vicingaceae bacterium]
MSFRYCISKFYNTLGAVVLPLMFLMVLYSCSSDAPQSSDKAQDAASIYDLTLSEHAILAPLRNRQNGTPRPKYFYDTSDGSAYVYTMQ